MRWRWRRGEDIVLLVEQIAFQRIGKGKVVYFAKSILSQLLSYGPPGNVHKWKGLGCGV